MKRKGDVMALIKCPECGNQISDKAESCPKCGYELNKKETPTISDNKVASSFMNKGNIIEIGTPKELISKTKTKNMEDAFVSLVAGGKDE